MRARGPVMLRNSVRSAAFMVDEGRILRCEEDGEAGAVAFLAVSEEFRLISICNAIDIAMAKEPGAPHVILPPAWRITCTAREYFGPVPQYHCARISLPPRCNSAGTDGPVSKSSFFADLLSSIDHATGCSRKVMIKVLLVEDSPGDVRLTREAFQQANNSIHLLTAADGVEALAFLRREGPQVHAPRPDIILLDLNLPKMSGHEVLAHIKSDESLKCIPVIVLTISGAEADIEKAYELQANCYLNKPLQLSEFESVVRSINEFWLTNVKFPKEDVARALPPRFLAARARLCLAS
jgi:chemotaxis family two-component system response regulator Rcp1